MGKNKIWLRYFALIVIFTFLFLALAIMKPAGHYSLTGFSVLEQKSGGDFSQGVYNNTFYNSSGFIQLNSSKLSGDYTSGIFDLGALSRWDNLSWAGEMPEKNNDIKIIPVLAYVLDKSRTSETQLITSQISQINNSDNVWFPIQVNKNTEYAYLRINWLNNLSSGSKINSAYVGVEQRVSIVSDVNYSRGQVYAGGYYYDACNLTLSVSDVTDNCNISSYVSTLGTINNISFRVYAKGITSKEPYEFFDFFELNINYSELANLMFELRNCSLSDCSDGAWQNASLSSLNLTGRYLQYRVFFSSPDLSITPKLHNITLGYSILNYAPSVNITSPQESSGYKIGEIIYLNFTASDADNNLASCWYNINSGANILLPACQNTTINAGIGSYIINVYANDTLGAIGSDRSGFSVTNTAPVITLVSPQEGATYGYNESIPLKFSVSDLDGNLDSCWYNLDSGENIIIINCENTTFNVAGDGNYALNIYANDSLAEQAVDSASFLVQLGAPTITLSYPIDEYLAIHDVVFIYTPEDTDLQACELWGDFNGEFKLNQTETSPINNAFNSFGLNLNDGIYLWNIRCNDTAGHFSFNGNKTFYIDTTAPKITLTEPAGTKNSRAGIPLQLSVNDSSPASCWYNVKWSTGQEVLGNTTINCSSTSFSLSADGDYILSFYARDLAGNLNSASSGFSVDTSAPSNSPSGSSGSSGGGGGGFSNASLKSPGKLELKGISNLIVDPGESRKLVLSVKNIGKNFLNDCRIKGEGKNSGWISSEEVKGLSSGEKKDFIFTLNVPETLKAGSYDISIGVACQEYTESAGFIAEIIEKKLAIDMISVERTGRDKLRVIYSLSEISGFDQKAEVQIVLFGLNNERLAEITEAKSIGANSSKQFEATLGIPESLSGNFNLLINAVSETSSAFIQEEVVLGAPSVGGFAVFGGTRGDIILSVILAALFVVFAVFIFRRILKFRKIHKLKGEGREKGIMMIDGRIAEKLKRELGGKNPKGNWINVKK